MVWDFFLRCSATKETENTANKKKTVIINIKKCYSKKKPEEKKNEFIHLIIKKKKISPMLFFFSFLQLHNEKQKIMRSDGKIRVVNHSTALVAMVSAGVKQEKKERERETR